MASPVISNSLAVLGMAGALLLLGGCATSQATPGDPLEGWNRGAQKFNDNLDTYIMKPIAQGYRWITPSFVDRGITNFFSNINDIGVTINDFLQFKLAQGGMDSARFLLNTTAGVGGFFDVAGKISLPKHEEDFDQTLGVWGVPMGPYVVLPFIGPSSPRGIVGMGGDALMNPLTYAFLPSEGIYSAISSGLSVINGIDQRADLLEAVDVASEAAVDRYDYFKGAYLQRREYLQYDGKVPEKDGEYDIDDESGEDAVTPSQNKQ